MKSSVDISVGPFRPEESVCCTQSTQRAYRQLRIPCLPSRPSEMRYKDIPDKQKLKEFIAIRPALEEMLTEVLQAETKRH